MGWSGGEFTHCVQNRSMVREFLTAQFRKVFSPSGASRQLPRQREPGSVDALPGIKGMAIMDNIRFYRMNGQGPGEKNAVRPVRRERIYPFRGIGCVIRNA